MLNNSRSNLKSLLNRLATSKKLTNVATTRSLAVKPFYYQELFEHAKPLNTPFKKLTGIFFSKLKI
jgi:hypothetical protein